ncbi:MAG: ABC transporter [Prevotella sp.]|nr:ABC transporter [Prevotella sp.]
MKRLFVIVLTIFSFALTSCDGNRELYELTDEFVSSLYTRYESYGILGGMDDTKYTSDRKCKVMPTGRLINVRIEDYATNSDYIKLRDKIAKHYKNDARVHDVYICGGGTIMIDCRRIKY